jgi:hypothetical protein
VTVLPGPMSPKVTSFLALPPATIIAGDNPHIKIVELDAFGNELLVHDSTVDISATVTDKTTGIMTPIVLNDITAPIFEIPVDFQIFGKFSVSVKANGTDFIAAEFRVVPGQACAYSSVVVIEITEATVVNSPINFIIRMRDAYGNELTHGGLNTLTAEAIHAGSPLLPGKVSDQENGRYQVTMLPVAVGAYSLFIYLDGIRVGESPYSFKVRPGKIRSNKYALISFNNLPSQCSIYMC